MGMRAQLLGIIIARVPVFSLSMGSQNLLITFRISWVLSHHDSLSKSWLRTLKQLQVSQPYCHSPEKQRLRGMFNGVASLFTALLVLRRSIM